MKEKLKLDAIIEAIANKDGKKLQMFQPCSHHCDWNFVAVELVENVLVMGIEYEWVTTTYPLPFAVGLVSSIQKQFPKLEDQQKLLCTMKWAKTKSFSTIAAHVSYDGTKRMPWTEVKTDYQEK